nr:two-component system response regulator [uncultured Desulfobacter sp.]
MTTTKQTILLVDDIPENVGVLRGILEKDYNIQVATSGMTALKIAFGQKQPDLILLDVMMPEMDGFEVCRRLKQSASTRKIPVIFVTSKNNVEDETYGFELGAVDYITKPVSPPIVLARAATHLALYDQNRVLSHKVAEAMAKLVLTQDVTILSMANLAEHRDPETGGHILRTSTYVRLLAERLINHPNFRDFLDAETIDLMAKSAPLHDIGKVGIPDAILLKPGKLTFDEFEEMKRHAIIGYKAISHSEASLGSENDSFLRYARQISRSHHEKWDGTGYPDGLSGNDIPIAGRLMALADVYDALISRRVYKKPFSHQKSVAMISELRGVHLDPDVVDAFLEIQDQFKETAMTLADSEEERNSL